MSASLHETGEHSSAAQTGSSSATEEQGRWYCSDTCPPYPSPDPAFMCLVDVLSMAIPSEVHSIHTVRAGLLA